MRKKVPGVDIRRHVGGTPSGSGTERGPLSGAAQTKQGEKGSCHLQCAVCGKGGRRCTFCLENHLPEDCKKVRKMEERKKLLIKFGRCFKCINKGH